MSGDTLARLARAAEEAANLDDAGEVFGVARVTNWPDVVRAVLAELRVGGWISRAALDAITKEL